MTGMSYDPLIYHAQGSLNDILCRREKDMVLFHNRGVLHTVVGAFKEDQVRAFHQCNLAASDDPTGPSEEDVKKWA